MTLAISLIVAGIVGIIIGMILGFSGLKKFWESAGADGPFSVRFLIAMIFDVLGGISLIIGIIVLILQYV